MHTNKLINEKARYETSYNTKIEIFIKYKNEMKRLGSILKEVNHNSCPLFLAIESRLEVKGNNIHVVINLRVKVQAEKWIQHKYLILFINEEHQNNN